MIVALIADVHANLPALEAVIQDMPTVDLWICAGDVVGYYDAPNEVCRRLQAIGAWVIRGNHDAYVTGQLAPHPDRQRAYRTEWTREILEPENRAWLATLPIEIAFQWGRRHIRLRHASPWDEETYLYPDATDKLSRIKLMRDEFLIVGHTHHPMALTLGEGLVINPGSVGQPRDWNPGASYAILETDSGAVEIRRVAYDISAYKRRLTERGWDPAVVSLLSRTRGSKG